MQELRFMNKPNLGEPNKVFEKRTDKVNFSYGRSSFSKYPDFLFTCKSTKIFIRYVFSKRNGSTAQNEIVVKSENKTHDTSNYPRDNRQRRANWIAGTLTLGNKRL